MKEGYSVVLQESKQTRKTNLNCKHVCSLCKYLFEAAWHWDLCLFLSLVKIYHIYTLTHEDFFFYTFISLQMTVGLAEKQMLAFCLSACVISSICISWVFNPYSAVFHFIQYWYIGKQMLNILLPGLLHEWSLKMTYIRTMLGKQ